MNSLKSDKQFPLKFTPNVHKNSIQNFFHQNSLKHCPQECNPEIHLYCPLQFFHSYYKNMNCLSESHLAWLMDIVCFFSGILSIRLIWRRFVQSNRLWLNATLPTKVSSLLFLFCEEYKAKEGPFWLGLTSTFFVIFAEWDFFHKSRQICQIYHLSHFFRRMQLIEFLSF